MLTRGLIAALLLLMTSEWQIVNGDEYVDCPTHVGEFGRKRTDTVNIACGATYTFQNSKCTFYKLPKNVPRKIRLTHINIPEDVSVIVGQIKVGDGCKLVYLTSADNGKQKDFELRYSGTVKFTASDTTAVIKFVCKD